MSWAISKYLMSAKNLHYIYLPNSVGTALGNSWVCSVLPNILVAKCVPQTSALVSKYSNNL